VPCKRNDWAAAQGAYRRRGLSSGLVGAEGSKGAGGGSGAGAGITDAEGAIGATGAAGSCSRGDIARTSSQATAAMSTTIAAKMSTMSICRCFQRGAYLCLNALRRCVQVA
jgi:hypothetical protein